MKKVVSLILLSNLLSVPVIQAQEQNVSNSQISQPAFVDVIEDAEVSTDPASNTTIVEFITNDSVQAGSQVQFFFGLETRQNEVYSYYNYVQPVQGEVLNQDGDVIGIIDSSLTVSFTQAVQPADTAIVEFVGLLNSGSMVNGGEFYEDRLTLFVNGQPSATTRFQMLNKEADALYGSYAVLQPYDSEKAAYPIDIYMNPTNGLSASVFNLQMTVPEGMVFEEQAQTAYQSGTVVERTPYESANAEGVVYYQEFVDTNVIEVSRFQPNGRRLDAVLTLLEEIEPNQGVQTVYVGRAYLQDESLLTQDGFLAQPIITTSPAGNIDISTLIPAEAIPHPNIPDTEPIIPEEPVNEIDDEEGSSQDEETSDIEWENTQDETQNQQIDSLSEEELEGAIEIPYAIEEEPTLEIIEGERRVVRPGRLGYSKDGEVIQEPISELVQVGMERDIIPYNTIRRPNPALRGDDEVVVQEGQYGLVPTDPLARIEPVEMVDEIIEYGPTLDDGATVIPYETTREANPNMLQGQIRIVQEGVYGYRGGDGGSRSEQDEIIEYGTRPQILEVEIPYGLTRRPNMNIPPGEERVITEGVNGLRKGDAIIRQPIQQVIEFGPTNSTAQHEYDVPYEIHYHPTRDIEPGQSNITQEGQAGKRDNDDRLLEEQTPQIIEYGMAQSMPADNVGFKTIYRPSTSLDPEEQIVKQIGVFGKQSSNGSVISEPVDEIIEFGLLDDGTYPNLNKLSNIEDSQSPYFRERRLMNQGESLVKTTSGIPIPPLPGGTMTPDNLHGAIDMYLANQPVVESESSSNIGLIIAIVVGLIVIGGAAGGGYYYYTTKKKPKHDVEL